MDITNEILAAYAEGLLTEAQRAEVRAYLTTHPEELEHVICLMDSTIDLPEGSLITTQSTATSAIGSSVAAFFIPLQKSTSPANPRKINIQKNIDNLLNELSL